MSHKSSSTLPNLSIYLSHVIKNKRNKLEIILQLEHCICISQQCIKFNFENILQKIERATYIYSMKPVLLEDQSYSFNLFDFQMSRF